jgi:hypothetical protein
MIYTQQFDSRTLRVPYECCYCNQVVGTQKFILRKTAGRKTMRQNHTLELPICEKCLHDYHLRRAVWYAVSALSFVSMMILLVVLVFVIDIPWITIVLTFVLEIIFARIFDKQIRESIKPVLLTKNGELKFRNKEYQHRFEALNSSLS